MVASWSSLELRYARAAQVLQDQRRRIERTHSQLGALLAGSVALAGASLVANPALNAIGRWIIAVTVGATFLLGLLAWLISSFDDAPDPQSMPPAAGPVSVQDAVEAMLYSIRQNELTVALKRLLTDLATLALAIGVGVLVLARAAGWA